MHPIVKVLFGVLMIIVGVYSSLTYSAELVNIIQAGIGPILIVVGAFIIWLESDEWKLSMEEEADRGMDVQKSLKDNRAASETSETETESQETSSDKISCPDCGKEFDTERGMKIHRTQKHD
jgi:hypothetical protein